MAYSKSLKKLKRQRVAGPKATKALSIARKALRAAKQAPSICHMYKQVNSNVASPLFSTPIDRFTDYSNTFGTLSNDQEGNKCQYYKDVMDIDVTLENAINNEEETITFTAYLVSLKNLIGSAFNPTTGALALTSGLHYINYGGRAELNPECFTIHRRKIFTLTNHGTDLANPSAQSQFGTNMRWKWNLYRKNTYTNPYGDWVSSPPPKPKDNAFLIIFNDNSTVDTESPTIIMQNIKTIKSFA